MVTNTRIEVRAGRNGGEGCVTLVQGAVQVRRLRDTGHSLRLALVAARALLLARDHIRVEVSVAGPVHVEIVETSGTVAYNMRGGSAAWDVAIDLRDGAELTWDGHPFVVADGADVARRNDIIVEGGCTATLRETIVFGRAAEQGGSLRTSTRIELDGRPLLAEDLDLGPDARERWATLNGHRCIDSVITVGHRIPEDVGVLQLENAGSIRRWIGDELHRSTSPTSIGRTKT